MTPTESFAAALLLNPADVTHCVLIGRRGDADVYAAGFWGKHAYTSGTIERVGEEWSVMRYAHDADVERIPAARVAMQGEE